MLFILASQNTADRRCHLWADAAYWDTYHLEGGSIVLIRKKTNLGGFNGQTFIRDKYSRLGSVGGSKGRTTEFCPSRLFLNPWMDWGFFSSGLQSIYSHWVSGFFLIMCNRVHVDALLSTLLLPIIIDHCKIYQLLSNNLPTKGKNKSEKRPRKADV